MKDAGLGRLYKKGEVVVRQGDKGDCMYVIQSGKAEVVQARDGLEILVGHLTDGDVFGEMALFEQQARSATVRAVTDVRALTVDKTIFLRRVHQDPSLAFVVMQKMSKRIRDLDNELSRLLAETQPAAATSESR